MKDKLKKMVQNAPLFFSFFRFLRNMFLLYPKWMLFKISKNWVVLNRINMQLRPLLWKLTGVNINGRVNIAYDVYYDVNCANMLFIEEGVWITPRVTLLCHRRDASLYYYGEDYNKLPYKIERIVLKKGCSIGIGSIILPGVTIGEGAMIGAGSVVTKDIPAWTVAAGNPAKVIKEVPKKSNNDK